MMVHWGCAGGSNLCSDSLEIVILQYKYLKPEYIYNYIYVQDHILNPYMKIQDLLWNIISLVPVSHFYSLLLLFPILLLSKTDKGLSLASSALMLGS